MIPSFRTIHRRWPKPQLTPLLQSNSVLVVGAGFTGASAARTLVEASDLHVTVVDARDHLAGNAYDPTASNGVRIHRYGPHAFHTSSEKIFRFLDRFTSWHSYEHRVLASVNGTLVPVPCNYDTITALAPTKGEEWIRSLRTRYAENQQVPLLRLRESESEIDRIVAELAYDLLFVEYTKKQWGLLPEELSPSVTGRVPIRMGWDDRYFTDTYQAIPSPGYLELIGSLLDHPRIEVVTSTPATHQHFSEFAAVLYTGSIDALCEFDLGVLPYRSLDFDFQSSDSGWMQSAAQINYPTKDPWTRITEFKYMTGQETEQSVRAIEYPQPYIPHENEPYYPIPRRGERSMHSDYQALAMSRFPNLVLAGRLADYRYYNMDQAVARGQVAAIQLARTHGWAK